MAHLRARHLTQVYEEILKFSPLIGLLGHRQVGKTTFLENQSESYLTFDDEPTRQRAQAAPQKFIESITRHHTAIDESQLVPGIFPALKERVRKSKRPGQITLSGSVRFTSKEAIRESLTGRIQYLELLPFSIAELTEQPLPHRLDLLLGSGSNESIIDRLSCSRSEMVSNEKRISQYLIQGGLPGICFIRKDSLRESKIVDQLKTILDRDLRQIHKSKLSFDELLNYLRKIGQFEGQPYDYQKFRRATGLSPITQKRLLYALESIFMIRRIPIERSSNGFSVIMEDQAESHFLTDGRLDEPMQILGLLYRNLRTELFYRTGHSARVFQFRNRSGSVIPIAFQSKDATVGFVFSDSAIPDRKTRGTAGVFLRNYPNSRVIIVHQEQKIHEVDSRVLSVPISCLV